MVKQSQGSLSSSVLSNCQPTIQDSNTIHLAFRAETSLNTFKGLEEQLLTYLKKQLQNNYITIITEVNKEKAKKVLYSNQEKFDHFSEQYPKLKDWKTKLGLELS